MNHYVKTLFLLTLSLSGLFLNVTRAQEAVEWQSGATDRVYSTPAIVGDKIFSGSIDGFLHCADLGSGRKYYQYQTNGRINSELLAYKNCVILVSGNDLICFDPESMSEKWRFLTESNPELAQLDEWDYHHSSPLLHEGVVYFGSGNGVLYGVDPETGEQVFGFESDENSPIRSTPTVKDDLLYFGDWEGVIYAVNLSDKSLNWKTRTWTGQHYDNFAGILNSVVVGDSMVYYGARNHKIKALHKSNGEPAWTYESPDGGWISGEPVIYGEYLLVAGSDNHKMLCFKADTGELIWDFTFPGNSFSKPVLFDDKIIFTTGNAYANTGQNYGRGFIHTLKLPGGELFFEQEFSGNIFSNPLMYNGNIYLGCDNKNIYALDGYKVAGITSSSIVQINGSNSPSPISNLKIFPNPINEQTLIEFYLKEKGTLKFDLFSMDGKLIQSSIFRDLPTGNNRMRIGNILPAHKTNADKILFAMISHNNTQSGSINIIQ